MTSLSNYFHMVGKHTVLHKSVKKKKIYSVKCLMTVQIEQKKEFKHDI